MLVCLSLALVLDSEKVKTAAVAERCDCETRLRGEAPRRWCAGAAAGPTRSYVIGSMPALIPTNGHNMCHKTATHVVCNPPFIRTISSGPSVYIIKLYA